MVLEEQQLECQPKTMVIFPPFQKVQFTVLAPHSRLQESHGLPLTTNTENSRTEDLEQGEVKDNTEKEEDKKGSEGEGVRVKVLHIKSLVLKIKL